MAFQPELYPENWSRRGGIRQTALERANYRCELCKVKQGTRRRNMETDEPYFVKLAVCHRLFYTTWKEDADTLVLCQRCHNRFDKHFRKRFKMRRETPVGYVSIYVPEGERMVLAAKCRTYIEIVAIIDSFEPGMAFEIYGEFNLHVVGNSAYLRTRTGVEVLYEYGSCEDLHQAFLVIPQRMKKSEEQEEEKTAM